MQLQKKSFESTFPKWIRSESETKNKKQQKITGISTFSLFEYFVRERSRKWFPINQNK